MPPTTIQPIINHGTDVVIAWATAITMAATIAMAVFSGIMLGQLGHIKKQNELLRLQGQHADDWQRKNNLITHFPYNVFKEYEKNLMDNLRKLISTVFKSTVRF